MIKIFFEVELEENNYIGFEDLMYKMDYDEELKDKLSKPRSSYDRGKIGRVTIQFYKHLFVIEYEFIAGVLLNCYVSASFNILNGDNYQNNFEQLYKDRLTFDFIDCKEIGVRIRHYSYKSYENEDEKAIFVSCTDYMVQEIIVPKIEFIEQTIICSEQYFAYLEKVNFPDPHLDSWKETVNNLKKQIYNL